MPNIFNKQSSLEKPELPVVDVDSESETCHLDLSDSFDNESEETIEFVGFVDAAIPGSIDANDTNNYSYTESTYTRISNDHFSFLTKRRVSVIRRRRCLYCLLTVVATILLGLIAVGIHSLAVIQSRSEDDAIVLGDPSEYLYHHDRSVPIVLGDPSEYHHDRGLKGDPPPIVLSDGSHPHSFHRYSGNLRRGRQ